MSKIQALLMLIVCFVLCSCIQYRDVTHDPAFHTNYAANSTYRLKQDAVMFEDNSEAYERPHGDIFKPGLSNVPDVDSLRSNPAKWSGYRFLKAGTKIQFRFMGLTKSPDVYYADVYGTIVEGPYAGTRVGLRSISTVTNSSNREIIVDSSWLEPVPK